MGEIGKERVSVQKSQMERDIPNDIRALCCMICANPNLERNFVQLLYLPLVHISLRIINGSSDLPKLFLMS